MFLSHLIPEDFNYQNYILQNKLDNLLKIDQIHYDMIETLRMVWLKSVPVIKKDAETQFNLDRFYAVTKLKDTT